MLTIDKVLVVDDDDYIRRIAEISLKKVGKWNVLLAKNGFEAVTIAKDEKPDLIVMDVTMPGQDGPATFLKLKEESETSSIPVIFLTGRVDQEDIDRFMELGIAGVIEKPFDPLKLPERICTLLDLEQPVK